MHFSRSAVAFFCASVFMIAGCSKQTSDDGHGHAHTAGDGHDHAHSAGDGHDHGKADTKAVAQHGSANAVPGSYEDWCGEHAVPESKCTRCDASLVAAFKATGDWCQEHGLPESQCLKCDPTRAMTRPPKPGAK